MDKNKIPTAIVVVAGIALLGLCVWQKVDKEIIAAVGAVLLALAGSMRGLATGGDK